MSNPINYQNPRTQNYSGVTINITNPTVSVPPQNCQCLPNNQQYQQVEVLGQDCSIQPYPQESFDRQASYSTYPKEAPQQGVYNQASYNIYPQDVNNINPNNLENNSDTNTDNSQNRIQDSLPQAYPAEYYLKDYNQANAQNPNPYNNSYAQQQPTLEQNAPKQEVNNDSINNQENSYQEGVERTQTTQEIINNLDSRIAEKATLKDNETTKKVVALTDEYIMSLENYLNHPNSDIRIMAAKEVLNRFGEDKSRSNDPALNALLNKMMQDPQKIVRIAALSALSSGIATGNDYTLELLNNIQNNPDSDKEDVLEVAQILLKMSQTTDTIVVKQDSDKYNKQTEQSNQIFSIENSEGEQ